MLTLKQLTEAHLESSKKLTDLELQISIEQLKQNNHPTAETQFYIDLLIKGFSFSFIIYFQLSLLLIEI